MFTLDTNAILYYLKGDERAFPVIEKVLSESSPVYVSVVTELELLSFSNSTEHEITLIEKLLTTVSIMSLDSRLARIAATLRRMYRLKTPDSIIAATSLFTGTILLTRNTRDFLRISEVTVQPI